MKQKKIDRQKNTDKNSIAHSNTILKPINFFNEASKMSILDLQGNARITCYAVTDGLTHTSNTSHYIGGVLHGKFKSLAICQFPNDNGYYLLYFDDKGEEITDTWHETLEDAKDQAEYEYQGITDIWITI